MIHRNEHNDNFTVISNDVVRNPDLSDGAKVLLLYLLTCSDDWDFNVKGISKCLNISTGAVSSRLKELQEFGFVTIKKVRTGQGKISSWIWDIYEQPHSKILNVVNPDSNLPNVVLPNVENLNDKEIPIVRNTNNKKEQRKETHHILGRFQNVFLTDSEQKELCEHFEYEDVCDYIERLSRYLNQHPDKEYKNHKSIIEKWIVEDKERKAI